MKNEKVPVATHQNVRIGGETQSEKFVVSPVAANTYGLLEHG